MCEQGFKNKKEARIIVAGANQKGYATIWLRTVVHEFWLA